MIPRLLLRNEATGASWQAWPEGEAIPAGNIRETGRYLFELYSEPAHETAVLLIDDQPLEALRASGAVTARWRWEPGFHAGTVEVELLLPGEGARRFEVITDPDRRKLTRQDFDAMVREILEDTFALFSLSGFRRNVGRGSGARPPPLARLEFLRSRIAEIEEVAAVIARAPRRFLTPEDAILPPHRAARATGAEIIRSLRSGRPLQETHGGPSRLPPVLKGMLPARIHTRQRRSSLDIAEHRQMAACLRGWAAWLSVAAGVLSRRATGEDGELLRTRTAWARRCRLLARRLTSLTALAPFAEAGEAPAVLQVSAVFRNDPAYRRFYRLWQDMNLGIAAVFGDFLGMPLARTFELYELWCFLRLVRAGAETWGVEQLSINELFVQDASGGVTLSAKAVTVPVGSGWKLCFQKQYREYWREADGRGSYSRTMVPDIVVAGSGVPADMQQLIVLDAKYRIEEGLGNSLNSIHTYRDALVRETESGRVEGIVTAAYLLSPHMAVSENGYRQTAMPGRLFHPEYRLSFRFGAVTMRPGMTQMEIGRALREIVADAMAV